MKFRLEIEMGNDAMQNRADVADALRTAAVHLEDTDECIEEETIRDDNGNSVGEWKFMEEPGEDIVEALRWLLAFCVSGRRYLSNNPYSIPEIERACKALAQNDWGHIPESVAGWTDVKIPYASVDEDYEPILDPTSEEGKRHA